MPTQAPNILEDDLLAIGQVAKLLTVSTRTIWRLVGDAELAYPLRIGGRRRWRRSQLEAFLEARAQEAEAEQRKRMKP